MGDDYDKSLRSVFDEVHDMQRNLVALVLTQYPDHALFVKCARDVQQATGCRAVQINAIMQEQQFSLITYPDEIGKTTVIPCEDSLCVLTVGFDQPLSLTDIAHSPWIGDHSTKHKWSSWASAPIHIDGYAAGTVCALESEHPRRWNVGDENVLRQAAQVIGDSVSRWRP